MEIHQNSGWIFSLKNVSENVIKVASLASSIQMDLNVPWLVK